MEGPGSPAIGGTEQQICAEGALGVRAAARFLGLGRTSLYERIAAGELRVVRLGRRTLIPKTELVRLLAEHLDGADQ